MFPEVVPSLGRSLLHEVANFFNLAHHTAGRKGKIKRMVIYPKTMFLDKQKSEQERLRTERDKIREKYMDKKWLPKPTENPQTFRDQVLQEIWDERNGKETQNLVTSNMIGGLDSNEIGKAPDAAKLRQLIGDKRKELEKLKVDMVKRVEHLKEQDERRKAAHEKIKEEEAQMFDHDKSSKATPMKDLDAEMLEDMDEETLKQIVMKERAAEMERQKDA